MKNKAKNGVLRCRICDSIYPYAVVNSKGVLLDHLCGACIRNPIKTDTNNQTYIDFK